MVCWIWAATARVGEENANARLTLGKPRGRPVGVAIDPSQDDVERSGAISATFARILNPTPFAFDLPHALSPLPTRHFLHTVDH